MRKLIALVVVLGALWVVAEIAIVPIAETAVEETVADRADGEAAVSADIDSFPLIAGVLVNGEVRNLSVTLEEVAGRAVTFADVRIDVHGVEVDRAAMLQRRARIRSIESGTITAAIDVGSLGPLARRVLSQTTVRVDGRTLRIGPVTLPLAAEIFPCSADVRVEGDTLVVSCAIEDVPDILT